MSTQGRIGLTLAPVALALATTASAVTLNPDGLGQALIYPYYTARAVGSDPLNTLVTIVNHSADAKVLRVRFREAKNAKVAASFNLYLSGRDSWTGAVAATASGGTSIYTSDRSCTNPAFASAGGDLRSLAFALGATFRDSMGNEPDRTREGWIEVIEMATLTGASASAVAHMANGDAANCPSVQGATPSLSIAPPSGDLSGTITLINVANGMDFSVNADALAGLSRQALYHPPDDPDPDFNAPEIDPISVVVANGFIYRSVWGRGADAVSAVLMRSSWKGEFTFETATNSKSEFVVTFPTRQHYVTQTQYLTSDLQLGRYFDAISPFTAAGIYTNVEAMSSGGFSREALDGQIRPTISTPEAPISDKALFIGPQSVADFDRRSIGQAFTSVLGSTNFATVFLNYTTVPSGWWNFATIDASNVLVSQQSSLKTNIATGLVIPGPHQFHGLPVTGFVVRTFENGTLRCGAVNCQGNYGAAFPLKSSRLVD